MERYRFMNIVVSLLITKLNSKINVLLYFIIFVLPKEIGLASGNIVFYTFLKFLCRLFSLKFRFVTYIQFRLGSA